MSEPAIMDPETGELLAESAGPARWMGPAQETVPGVFRKLNEVMGQVGRIAKRGRNDFHGYDYATEADIVDEVRPLMAEAGLAFIPAQGERTEVEVQTKSGTATIVRIRHIYRFVDIEDGSYVEVPVWGEGQDSMDKGSYKAFTGSEKYALMKTFMLATGDDPEKDGGERKPAEHPKRRQYRKPDGSPEADALAPDCPECGSPMKRRKGKKGEFFGCTRYPDCKGTRQVGDAGGSEGSQLSEAEASRPAPSPREHARDTLLAVMRQLAGPDEDPIDLVLAYAAHLHNHIAKHTFPADPAEWDAERFKLATEKLDDVMLRAVRRRAEEAS